MFENIGLIMLFMGMVWYFVLTWMAIFFYAQRCAVDVLVCRNILRTNGFDMAVVDGLIKDKKVRQQLFDENSDISYSAPCRRWEHFFRK